MGPTTPVKTGGTTGGTTAGSAAVGVPDGSAELLVVDVGDPPGPDAGPLASAAGVGTVAVGSSSPSRTAHALTTSIAAQPRATRSTVRRPRLHCMHRV